MKNLFLLIGNLTRDFDVANDEGSRGFLAIAVDRTWKDASGARQQRTDFFRVKVFGALAVNAAKYLGKGSLVSVAGRLEPTRWERDGKVEYGMDLVADEIDYLGTRAPAGAAEDPAAQ